MAIKQREIDEEDARVAELIAKKKAEQAYWAE
jgi:hypothetical protein